MSFAARDSRSRTLRSVATLAGDGAFKSRVAVAGAGAVVGGGVGGVAAGAGGVGRVSAVGRAGRGGVGDAAGVSGSGAAATAGSSTGARTRSEERRVGK